MALVDTWRWDEESYVLAWEAGVFRDQRVELVEGEVWPVSIGSWPGAVAGNVTRLLPDGDWRVTSASLPAAGSVTDPDVWAHRRGARPVARLGATGRLARWSAGDVALVVEVADTTFAVDTEVKARLYGRSGFAAYWVVHRAGVEVFTDPSESGYRRRAPVPPTGSLAVPYRPEVVLDVAALLDVDE
jgi:hypothetical protein